MHKLSVGATVVSHPDQVVSAVANTQAHQGTVTVIHCSRVQVTGRNSARMSSQESNLQCSQSLNNSHYSGIAIKTLVRKVYVTHVSSADSMNHKIQTCSNPWHTEVTQMFTKETKAKHLSLKASVFKRAAEPALTYSHAHSHIHN